MIKYRKHKEKNDCNERKNKKDRNLSCEAKKEEIQAGIAKFKKLGVEGTSKTNE